MTALPPDLPAARARLHRLHARGRGGAVPAHRAGRHRRPLLERGVPRRAGARLGGRGAARRGLRLHRRRGDDRHHRGARGGGALGRRHLAHAPPPRQLRGPGPRAGGGRGGRPADPVPARRLRRATPKPSSTGCRPRAGRTAPRCGCRSTSPPAPTATCRRATCPSPARSPTGWGPAPRWTSRWATACASCSSATATAWASAPWTGAWPRLRRRRAADPRTRALLARLRGLGIDLLPKVATDEFGLCNVYCVGDRARGGRGVPDHAHRLRRGRLARPRARAAQGAAGVRRRARAQDLQPRAARPVAARGAAGLPGQLPRPPQPGRRGERRAWRPCASGSAWTGRPARARWPTACSRAAAPGASTRCRPGTARSRARRWWRSCRRLAARGCRSWCWTGPRPDTRTCTWSRSIVPGLEVETMSYHRIGERGVRKLLERGSPLVGLGAAPAGARAGAADRRRRRPPRRRSRGSTWPRWTASWAASTRSTASRRSHSAPIAWSGSPGARQWTAHEVRLQHQRHRQPPAGRRARPDRRRRLRRRGADARHPPPGPVRGGLPAAAGAPGRAAAQPGPGLRGRDRGALPARPAPSTSRRWSRPTRTAARAGSTSCAAR